MNKEQRDEFFREWQKSQEMAEKMLPIIGVLWRNCAVAIRIYGRSLNNRSATDIIKAHLYVRQRESFSLALEDTFPLLESLISLNPRNVEIDLGKLTVQYIKEGRPDSALGYLRQHIQILEMEQSLTEADAKESRDVVLYGFGRIGRLLARLLVDQVGAGRGLKLRAIVVRGSGSPGTDLERRASLLRRDSIHGPFNGAIVVDPESNSIIANGEIIKLLYSDAQEQVDYRAEGIDNAVLIDNTGRWRDEAELSKHLQAPGIAKVLLTAPGKGGIKNIVYGVNQTQIEDSDTLISAASCTTNAIAPVLRVINDKYGIEYGHVETVHSYTSDQNLIDNYHKADRRGRSAPLNMVLTETGAAKAVAKVIPELAGKLTANAIRVPTPDVSMAIMNLTLKQSTSREELNSFLRECALYSDLGDQIDFMTSTELVSSDLVGSQHAAVVDSHATIVNDNHAVIYVWYDNEFGYSCQVLRVAQKMAGVKLPQLPR